MMHRQSLTAKQFSTIGRPKKEPVKSVKKAKGAPKSKLTVRDAIEAYLAIREAKECNRKGKDAGLKRDARSRLTKHVLNAYEALAKTPLKELAAIDLSKWRRGRATALTEASIR
jgi:hypothetical protein